MSSVLRFIATAVYKSHGKRKKLPAKEKSQWQQKTTSGKKDIAQGKRRKLAAKEKFSQRERNRSRQKKKSCSNTEILQQQKVHCGKRKMLMAKNI